MIPSAGNPAIYLIRCVEKAASDVKKNKQGLLFAAHIKDCMHIDTSHFSVLANIYRKFVSIASK